MAEVIDAIVKLLNTPTFWWVLLCLFVYWVFSAFVSTMEMPTAASSKRYVFWFKFLNHLAGSVKRALAVIVPGAEKEK